MVKVCKIILLLVLLSCFPLSTSAATVSFSRPGASFKVGNTFSVTAYVNSAQEAMNAASGTISFSRDTIEAVSLNRSGSIFSFWAQEPSIGAGSVSFAGIVPSPGYKGGAGKIVTINFRAKAPGAARVSFSSGSILANDGNGTNIYTGAGSVSMTIAAADPVVTPPEKPTTPETVVTPPTSVVTPELTPVTPAVEIAAPIITYYPDEIEFADPLKIRGTSYPSSEIVIRVKQDGVVVHEEKTKSDESGTFITLISKRFASGAYDFTAQVTDPQGLQSKETAALAFVVNPQSPVDFGSRILDYLALIVLGLLALIGLATIVVLMWHWLRLLIRHHREKMLVKSFGTMREYIEHYLLDAKSFKGKQKLTRGNVQFLEKFAKSTVAAENIITQSVKKVPAKKTLTKKAPPKKVAPKKLTKKKSLK